VENCQKRAGISGEAEGTGRQNGLPVYYFSYLVELYSLSKELVLISMVTLRLPFGMREN